MFDKKTLTLGELHELIDEEDAYSWRVLLFIEDDGTSEEDSNTMWLFGENGIEFKDWIVTKIGFRAGTIRIFIKQPLKEASNHIGV